MSRFCAIVCVVCVAVYLRFLLITQQVVLLDSGFDSFSNGICFTVSRDRLHSLVAAAETLDSLTKGPGRDLETLEQVGQLCVRRAETELSKV